MTGAWTAEALAQTGGAETVTLTTNQLPTHTHVVQTATGAQVNGTAAPGGNFIADETFSSPPNPRPFTYAPFVSDANQRTLGAKTVQNAGGSQPHDNRQPYLGMNYCIALQGVFPSRQ